MWQPVESNLRNGVARFFFLQLVQKIAFASAWRWNLRMVSEPLVPPESGIITFIKKKEKKIILTSGTNFPKYTRNSNADNNFTVWCTFVTEAKWKYCKFLKFLKHCGVTICILFSFSKLPFCPNYTSQRRVIHSRHQFCLHENTWDVFYETFHGSTFVVHKYTFVLIL